MVVHYKVESRHNDDDDDDDDDKYDCDEDEYNADHDEYDDDYDEYNNDDTWLRNTFSMSSSSRLHLLMFSSSCLYITFINKLSQDCIQYIVAQ